MWSNAESAGWQNRRQWELGIRLGMFLVFGLPALIGLFRYFVLEGGSTAGLVAALPEVMLETVLEVIAVVGPLGALVIVAILLVLRRTRSN